MSKSSLYLALKAEPEAAFRFLSRPATVRFDLLSLEIFVASVVAVGLWMLTAFVDVDEFIEWHGIYLARCGSLGCKGEALRSR
jgi:hypothetical protein